MNSSMGNFGDETREREEIDGGLVERIGDVRRIDIGDKTSFIGKREGVEVPVREPMQGGMIHPGVGCGRNGMVKRGVKAGRRSTRRLEGGIGCGGRTIVSKS